MRPGIQMCLHGNQTRLCRTQMCLRRAQIWLRRTQMCFRRFQMVASFELSFVSPDNLQIDDIGEKSEKWRLEFGGEERASSMFRWRKIHVLDMNFNIPRTQIWNIIEKRLKIANIIFLKMFGNLMKCIQFCKVDQKSFFFLLFLYLIIKNHIKI